ncbi:Transposase-associated domain [Arabidopsis thaliana x Arabidopsis arenosa]|uniref:Transposase-associated domain n=1 Tax=Arabidopsis thaliana x Arabidopsis arenosa TaxID=1240361 RepID=A0A8T1ZLQ6_9BRAS|nr:Transposase-associated domain [Arabidopsis thaliana x Arabidopsis arenosa]
MDKSWITKHRLSQDYINGVKEFLDFAFGYSKTYMIKCPCQRCFLVKHKNRTEIEGDLVCHGFLPTYTNWYLHGEELDFQEQEVRLEHESDDDHVENPTMNLLGDVFPSMSNSFNDDAASMPTMEDHSKQNEVFDDLLADCNEAFDKGMSMILDLLKEAFEHAKLPKSFNDMKKIIRKLGFNYENIHVCPNDCMLFWGDDASRETCKVCESSRWKTSIVVDETLDKKKKKKQLAAKVLRYFPLKPRLQRFFMSSKTAKYMRWHADSENKDAGPSSKVLKFSAYNINGFKFRIIERDQDLKTQNSGIFVSAETISYASSRDINPRSGNVSYYGKLTEILELNYYDSFRVVLFKCKWVDTRDARGFKKDQFGHSMVNFSRLIHTGSGEEDEPYVLASQARLVYYVEDPQEKDWSVVVHVQPRDLYDMEDPTSSDEIPPQFILKVLRFHLIYMIIWSMSETDSQAPPPLGPELASGKWRVRVIDGDRNITEEKISGKEVWGLLNRRVMVDFNRRGQVIKDSGGLFGSWLGSLSNDLNILPINYTDWRKVPNYRKEMAWKVIQKKFWFDNPRRRKKYVLSALGEEETGKEPNRAELFIASRTRSDGSLLSNEARITVDKLSQVMTENIQDEASNTESRPYDAFEQVFGSEPTGRVRCVGRGVTPSKYLLDQESVMSSNAEILELKTRLKGLEDKLEIVTDALFVLVKSKTEGRY